MLGNDVVPRLNFPAICELRNEVLDAISRAKVSKMLIMQAIFRDFDVRDLMYPRGEAPESDFKTNISKFQVRRFFALSFVGVIVSAQDFIKATLANLALHELCLPGRILHLSKVGTGEKVVLLALRSFLNLFCGLRQRGAAVSAIRCWR